MSEQEGDLASETSCSSTDLYRQKHPAQPQQKLCCSLLAELLVPVLLNNQIAIWYGTQESSQTGLAATGDK